MSPIGALLLTLSIIFSGSRNILSKGISGASIGTKYFFFMQFLIFGTGSVVLCCFGGISLFTIAPTTLYYALIYALALISAQWCYTIAMKSGKTGICSTVYAMGFIFPTLSGVVFWNESLGVWKILGIALVIPTIILSGLRSKDAGALSKSSHGGYILPLLISMTASGTLGIMQKLQQASACPEQKNEFVLIAFATAALVSLLCAAFGKKSQEKATHSKIAKTCIAAAGVGVCFALCNTLNTTLAGMLETAVFFPTLNIGSILISLLLGFLIYKEKPTKKDIPIPLLGISAVLLINL